MRLPICLGPSVALWSRIQVGSVLRQRRGDAASPPPLLSRRTWYGNAHLMNGGEAVALSPSQSFLHSSRAMLRFSSTKAWLSSVLSLMYMYNEVKIE